MKCYERFVYENPIFSHYIDDEYYIAGINNNL
jgi:hypothetical protein